MRGEKKTENMTFQSVSFHSGGWSVIIMQAVASQNNVLSST